MKAAPVLALLLLVPSFATAEPAPSDVLTEDEGLTMCAEQLPKQLACKEEFCASMVAMRAPNADESTAATMHAKCLEEIAVDGAGDSSARKARCAGWAKQRPKLVVKRSKKKAMDACWTKPTCDARVSCWAPKMRELMQPASSEGKKQP